MSISPWSLNTRLDVQRRSTDKGCSVSAQTGQLQLLSWNRAESPMLLGCPWVLSCWTVFFLCLFFYSVKKTISGLLLQGLKEKKTNIVSITEPFLLPVFTFYNAGLFQINEFEGVPLEYAAGLHSTHSSPKGQSSKFTETRSQWLLGSVYIVGEE